MEIESPELMNYIHAPHNKAACNEIGDIGENIIADIFDENNISYYMTGYDCPVDFVVPLQREVLGIEVKTSLTEFGRVVLTFNKDDRDVKKWYCQSHDYNPITVLINRKDPENGTFDILWKRGIKRFHIDRMWDFNTFLRDYRAPVMQFKDETGITPSYARCEMCGRFSFSYATKKVLHLSIPGIGRRFMERHVYQCARCIGPKSMWREVDRR